MMPRLGGRKYAICAETGLKDYLEEISFLLFKKQSSIDSA
jgi:hypothetical protein